MIRRFSTSMCAAGLLGVCLLMTQGVVLAGTNASLPQAAGSAVAQGIPPAVPSFTLDQAVQETLTRNPQVIAAQEAVAAAEQHLLAARAGFIPAITTSVTGSYGTATTLGPPTTDPRTSSTVSVTGTLPLYDNGRTGIAVAQAQATLAAAQATLRRTQQDVALSTANAVFAVLKAGRIAAVRQVQFNRAQEQLALAQAQVRAGTAAQADVIQAQAQVAQAQVDLLAAVAQIETSKGTLRSILAMDVLAPLEIQEPALPPTALTLTADTALREALGTRPEIAKATADIQSSTAALALAYANAGFQVVVALDTTYVLSSTNPSFANTTAWALAATLSLPFFDGGRGQAGINEAKANLRAAQALADAAQLSVRQDAYQAFLTAVQAVANLEATAAAQAAAGEALRVAEGRYRAGVATIFEVTTARVQAAQADVNAVTGRYDYQASLATLRHAVGRAIVGGIL